MGDIGEIWVGEHQETLEDIKVDARRFAGIIGSVGPGVSDEDVALAIKASLKRVAALRSTLLACDHPLVLDTLRNGLPISAAEQLNDSSFKCPSCGFPLETVPCVFCSCRPAPFPKDEAALPQAPEPTRFPPGSERKMIVMRWRASKGFSVFHDGDEVDFSHLASPYGRAAEPIPMPAHTTPEGLRQEGQRD